MDGELRRYLEGTADLIEETLNESAPTSAESTKSVPKCCTKNDFKLSESTSITPVLELYVKPLLPDTEALALDVV